MVESEEAIRVDKKLRVGVIGGDLGDVGSGLRRQTLLSADSKSLSEGLKQVEHLLSVGDDKEVARFCVRIEEIYNEFAREKSLHVSSFPRTCSLLFGR